MMDPGGGYNQTPGIFDCHQQSKETMDTTDPLVKTRLNLAEPNSSNACFDKSDSICVNSITLRKHILAYKIAQLSHVQMTYSEHVHELFYLQGGGNLMDYSLWVKKPKPVPLVFFCKSMQLEAPIDPISSDTINSTTNLSEYITTYPNSANTFIVQPHCLQTNNFVATSSTYELSKPSTDTEVSISGIGATPVAVSTTLPAAVAQLNIQGGMPLDVQTGILSKLSCEISNSKNQNSSVLPTNKTYSLDQSTGNCVLLNATNDNFSEKVRQEVYVIQRICDLQREGLWSDRRLPKYQEPQRAKAHWDYLLEEMVWLASDFAQERKWKKAAAKKCSRMVLKYFSDKAMSAQRAEKAHELHLRRIAAMQAKEIKVFWSNVEKLVEYKQHTQISQKRKQAMDQHLSFIVDQTERFSKQLAVGMNKVLITPTESNPSSRLSSLGGGSTVFSDDEFSPGNASSSDDEETIAQAEREIMTIDVKDEIAQLKKESEMDMNEFLNVLPSNYLKDRDILIRSECEHTSSKECTNDGNNKNETNFLAISANNINDVDDCEYSAHECSEDDEDTICQEEQHVDQVDHKMEIDLLRADNDMTIEELMDKYNLDAVKSDNEDADDISNSDNSDSMELSDDFGLNSLLDDNTNTPVPGVVSKEDKSQIIHDAAALAESIQPKGNTLSSTKVATPVPFLLKHSLREYQHIGLDWLVTMHDRKLNGILADEMGLGKTIQTIALLAHLACVKEIWGPHLIIVPSSVMLNWEMEFKKWCPGFKILTYYGTQKERKLKRVGWTKINAFHICITSYKLVIQDHKSFRRKKWQYLILDEAQNIKNFKSQRWQLLLNFSTEHRLLLTGTPLQNNLMELWSLMHFLMPNVFQSHREFKEWFSNPMAGMVEGNSEYNESIIIRLHKVLRPFLLRRLKSEVEKQMPKKFEHVVMCRLSNRQRYLYDDFMNRAKTQETLASGNFLSVINILMQLRKVCNHPNMFEARPTISPFRMEGLRMHTTSKIYDLLNYDPFNQIDLISLNILLVQLEFCITAYVSHRIHRLQAPRSLITEMSITYAPPPRCPTGKLRLYVRFRDAHVQTQINRGVGCVKVGTSPALKIENYDKQSNQRLNLHHANDSIMSEYKLYSTGTNVNLRKRSEPGARVPIAALMVPNCQNKIISSNCSNGSSEILNHNTRQPYINSPKIAEALAVQLKSHSYAAAASYNRVENHSHLPTLSAFSLEHIERMRMDRRLNRLQFLGQINHRRCSATPLYGSDLRDTVLKMCSTQIFDKNLPFYYKKELNQQIAIYFSDAFKTLEQRTHEMQTVFSHFVIYVPAVSAPLPILQVSHANPSRRVAEKQLIIQLDNEMRVRMRIFHPIVSAMNTQFPDRRLIQYDCGKLQTLDLLLRNLKTGGHRVLIFTQMTRMLDILEAFLNFHGHIYLRLDGTTRIEQRQILMDRFNNDRRIFVFILSTRSGGVGVNLTGADTVIFYDSDWNPTMDAQAQDRCHRIGQTRDVHIYRLVSEKTIEENILKKANQKRMLGSLAIDGGHFTTDYFRSTTIQDLFVVDNDRKFDVIHDDAKITPIGDNVTPGELESLLAAVEDEQDVDAARIACAEAVAELDEFDESIPIEETKPDIIGKVEMSKEELEVENVVNMLNPVERYAMRFIEQTGGLWIAKQLRIAEEEIEEQKRNWEADRLAALQKEREDEMSRREEELLTYSRMDANNQIWISDNTGEIMPMWCPPTPPQDNNDIYLDQSLSFLYEQKIIPESELPQVYIKKDLKRTRFEAGYLLDSRAVTSGTGVMLSGRIQKIPRKDDIYFPPRSMFDRPTPAMAKLRRDLKLQRYRSSFKSNYLPQTGAAAIAANTAPSLKSPLSLKSGLETEMLIDWSIYEDIVILNVLQQLQGLPLNLMLLSPGHSPNWDLVSECVNHVSRMYRTPKQCRFRYETIIVPREEGKVFETISPKKQKNQKNKTTTALLAGGPCIQNSVTVSCSTNNPRSITTNTATGSGIAIGVLAGLSASMVTSSMSATSPNGTIPKNVSLGPITRPVVRTSQNYAQDNNVSFLNFVRSKFEAISNASLKRAPQIKQVIVNPSIRNPKHAAVLGQFGITNYDHPQSAIDIAVRRAEKFKEKQRGVPLALSSVGQAHNQQQTHQPIHLQHQKSSIHVGSIGNSDQHMQKQPLNHASILPQMINSQQSIQMQTLQQPHNPGCFIIQQATVQQLQYQQNPTSITNIQQSPSVHTGIQLCQSTQITPKLFLGNAEIHRTNGQFQHVNQQNTQQQPQHLSSHVQHNTPVSMVMSNIGSSASIGGSQVPKSSMQPTIQCIPAPIQSSSMLNQHHSQNVPSVSNMSQFVSVTSAILPASTISTFSNSPGSTSGAGGMRAQRIIQGKQIHEVVLQRSDSKSPTVVSVSGMQSAGGGKIVHAGGSNNSGQSAQLRLSMGSSSVTKSIPIASSGVKQITQSGLVTATSAGGQSLVFRPQRQQLKVIHSSGQAQHVMSGHSSNTMQPTTSGLTHQNTNPGIIHQQHHHQLVTVGCAGGQPIQNISTSTSGQKLTIGTSDSVNIGSIVTTTNISGKSHFVKQIGSKQAITTARPDSATGEMLVVKRQIIDRPQHHQQMTKGQILTQHQAQQMLATPSSVTTSTITGNIVVQSPGGQTNISHLQLPSSNNATIIAHASSSSTIVNSGSSSMALVKTSGSPVGMTISQLKSGNIKTTIPNQMRQMQLHQQMTILQQRKASCASGGSGINVTSVQSHLSSGSGITAGLGGKITQMPAIAKAPLAGTSSCVSPVSSSGNTLSSSAMVSGGLAGNISQIPTQLIVQSHKNTPSTVTVFRQQNTQSTGQILLGKTSINVGRVVPVSVSTTYNNHRQIQLVSGSGSSGGGMRTTTTNIGSIQTIKTVGSNQQQNSGNAATAQHTIYSAIQQHQTQQRQSAGQVRVQTTAGGSLLTLAVHQNSLSVNQQQSNDQQIQSSTESSNADCESVIVQTPSGSTSQQRQHHQLQHQPVKPIVKKRLHSFRLNKN